MSDYPLIDPADVIAGDTVHMADRGKHGRWSIEGVVSTDEDGDLWIRHGSGLLTNNDMPGFQIEGTELRLIHRPDPPEPALRVGDWVRTRRGTEGQIVGRIDGGYLRVASLDWHPSELTRIEPPVGWPVAVPDPDAPGGVRWWVKYHRTSLYLPTDATSEGLSWADLVAAGGVPALAPEPTP